MRDALGAVQSVLVLGGSSEIALATVKELARGRCRTAVLAGRDVAALEPVAADLRSAGVTDVDLVTFDAADPASHQAVIDDIFGAHPDLDVVIMAFGVLGDQDEFDRDPVAAAEAVVTNFAGAVSAGLAVAQHLQATGARHPGGDHLGGGRAGPGRQPGLRLHQGRPRRLRPGPRRPPGRQRRIGHGRPPGLRAHR